MITDNEMTLWFQRIINIENRVNSAPIPTDFSAVIAKQHQDILKLQNQISLYQKTFESHFKEIQNLSKKYEELKAGEKSTLLNWWKWKNPLVRGNFRSLNVSFTRWKKACRYLLLQFTLFIPVRWFTFTAVFGVCFNAFNRTFSASVACISW